MIVSNLLVWVQRYDFYDYLFFASKAKSSLPWFTDPDHTHTKKVEM